MAEDPGEKVGDEIRVWVDKIAVRNGDDLRVGEDCDYVVATELREFELGHFSSSFSSSSSSSFSRLR